MTSKLRSIFASVFVLVLGYQGSASAELITIGTLQFAPCCIEIVDLYPGTADLFIGTSGTVTNESPVAFSSLEMTVILDIAHPPAQGGNVCNLASLAPGDSFACMSGPVVPAPDVGGLAYHSAIITGSLSNASFFLTNGDLFTASSTNFVASGAGVVGSVPIQIDGTRVPTPVPEPSTLLLTILGLLGVRLRGARRGPG